MKEYKKTFQQNCSGLQNKAEQPGTDELQSLEDHTHTHTQTPLIPKTETSRATGKLKRKQKTGHEHMIITNSH